MRRKLYSLLPVLAAGVFAFAGCGKVAPIYKGTLHGSKVVVFTKPNSQSLISVHADATKVLQIGPLQFENIRGLNRGFEEIEQFHTLIFVTEEGGAAFVHAFDLLKNVDVKAPLGDASGFGYWLGNSNQQYQAVTMLTSNKLYCR